MCWQLTGKVQVKHGGNKWQRRNREWAPKANPMVFLESGGADVRRSSQQAQAENAGGHGRLRSHYSALGFVRRLQGRLSLPHRARTLRSFSIGTSQIREEENRE